MIELAPHDVLNDKPFTHADHTTSDLRNLERLRHALIHRLHNTTDDQANCQQHVELVEEDGRAMRHIVVRPRALLGVAELTVVGFCGHKHEHLHLQEQEAMAKVDADLVAELCRHRHMLCYCSIETGDGDWHNLVLMSHNEAIGQWREGERHRWAVDSLTPRFYRHIRLHNGLLPRGLASKRIVLTSTKYYDFDDEMPWRAVRHFHL